MFEELAGQSWVANDTTGTIANSTDTSIDGSSRKLTWVTTTNGYVTITFTSIDLSEWEELSFHVYLAGSLSEDDIFRITIDSETFNYSRYDFVPSKWNHMLLDCSNMGVVTTMTITCLVTDLVMFIDYIGVRKVTFNMDVDIIEALKDHIHLDYDVATTLSANATAGDESISLTDITYINDTAVLEIDNGAGTVETVELISKTGSLSEALANSFSSGNEVRAICPVRSEDYDSLEPDPICGVKVFDITADRREDIISMKNGTKVKEYLGHIGIVIYIDCSSKKKLLQMAREFNKTYGNEFQFLLDGERVDIYMESDVFNDGELGSNPRMAYYYRIEPQPYLLMNSVQSVTNTVNIESVPKE